MNRRDFLCQAAIVSIGGAACGGCATGSAESVMHGLATGDSIAWQYSRGLREGLADFATIESLATPGITSAQLAAQLQAFVAEGKRWDFVVLNGAWNDLMKERLTPFQHWQNVQNVIDAAEQLANHWYWVSTTPTLEAGSDELRNAVNDAALGFCARRNGVYVPADEFLIELGGDVLLEDGLHLAWGIARLVGEFIALEIGRHLQEMAGRNRIDLAATAARIPTRIKHTASIAKLTTFRPGGGVLV